MIRTRDIWVRIVNATFVLCCGGLSWICQFSPLSPVWAPKKLVQSFKIFPRPNPGCRSFPLSSCPPSKKKTMVSPHLLGFSIGPRWKFSCFVLKKNYAKNHNNLAFHPRPQMPPSGEGSPIDKNNLGLRNGITYLEQTWHQVEELIINSNRTYCLMLQ